MPTRSSGVTRSPSVVPSASAISQPAALPCSVEMPDPAGRGLQRRALLRRQLRQRRLHLRRRDLQFGDAGRLQAVETPRALQHGRVPLAAHRLQDALDLRVDGAVGRGVDRGQARQRRVEVRCAGIEAGDAHAGTAAAIAPTSAARRAREVL